LWCFGLGTLGFQPSFLSHFQIALGSRGTPNASLIAARSAPSVQWTGSPLAVLLPRSHDLASAFCPGVSFDGLGLFALRRRPSTPPSL
jgi:hypothetical protein